MERCRLTIADVGVEETGDGKRYELIQGELHVSDPTDVRHQATCSNILMELHSWDGERSFGKCISAPGIIFADDEVVAPDIVWFNKGRKNLLDQLLAFDDRFFEL